MKHKPVLTIIITAITLLSFPDANFGQAPNLGSTANFVFFTSVGAVSNTGISRIYGNVGTNAGAITGFGGLNGVIDSVNSVTAQGVLDLFVAYTELNLTIPTSFPGVLLGNGQVLTPGVYSIGAATTLSLGLTLNAQGNPNAVFIFKITGAFSTTTNATIILTNGASACNVYWKVEGAISMAAGSTMRGTLIANNGAISMAAGDTLEGRALSTTGAVAVNGVVAIIGCNLLILPIELTSFTGVCKAQNVVLNWSTPTETDISKFTIERSVDGIEWNAIGAVGGTDNSSFSQSYSFTDSQPGYENSYYRLMQTNPAGNNTYGTVIAIEKCANSSVENLILYPNPSSGKFTLAFTGDPSQINSTEVFDAQGRKVLESYGFQPYFDLSNERPGLYFVRIHMNSKYITQEVLVAK